MDRRSFLRFGSLAAGSYALFACGGGKAKPDAEQSKKNAAEEEEPEEEEQEEEVEDQEFYTRDEPGRWKGKEESHLPKLTAADGRLTIKTEHTMGKGHYITRLQLRNEGGSIIADKVLTEKDKPETTFIISMPSGTKFSAVSICNLHGTWKEDLNVADFTAGFGRSTLFSKENPGPWAGLEDVHIPTLKNTRPGAAPGRYVLEVATNHIMETAHSITKHEIKNMVGEVLAQSWFNPMTDKAPLSFMEILLPSTGIQLVSTCNMHGIWVADVSFDRVVGVATTANPSATGDAASHIPTIALTDTGVVNNSSYRVAVNNRHEMVANTHFLSRHEVRTTRGDVIADAVPVALRVNNNQGPIASSSFDGRIFQGGAGQYAIYTYCNMHGVWKEEFKFEQLNLVFMDTPGRAGGVVGAEKPTVTVEAETITVKNEHAMANDHYIMRHQVRKDDGSLIFEKGFLPTSASATSIFPKAGLAAGNYVAYSYCNQHGIWKAPFTIA